MASVPTHEAAKSALMSMTFRSDPSPCLPLRKAPHAPPRIPREGYVGLLVLVSEPCSIWLFAISLDGIAFFWNQVALLLMTIWALLLLCAFLYLGVLEQRFGVDILADGGVYEQLFMLRGVHTLTAAAHKQLQQLDLQETWRSCEVVARSVAALCLDGVQEASVAVQALLRK